MQNVWILGASTAAEGQSEVSAEPVGQGGQAITVADANASGQPAPAKGPPGYYQLIFIGVIFLVMYLILFREPRKKQKQHQQMVQSLKKNDKVRTIGGILGTVVDIKGDEIILKVDESNNTKIRVVASAIGKNLMSEGQ
ncbi:MAG: preprotein translocase subunit YajC [Sedimentisphaerales bacterium]|nr:preprotein translocase subunit YajC [Sedimentisphaerales bacterium]